MRKETILDYICPKCGYNRWKTVIKGKKYQCRNKNCNYIKEMKR